MESPFENNWKRLEIKSKNSSQIKSTDRPPESVYRFSCIFFNYFSNSTVITELLTVSIFGRPKVIFRSVENDRLSVKWSKTASFHSSLYIEAFLTHKISFKHSYIALNILSSCSNHLLWIKLSNPLFHKNQLSQTRSYLLFPFILSKPTLCQYFY